MKPIVVFAVVASLKIFADEACHSAAALELAKLMLPLGLRYFHLLN